MSLQDLVLRTFHRQTHQFQPKPTRPSFCYRVDISWLLSLKQHNSCHMCQFVFPNNGIPYHRIIRHEKVARRVCRKQSNADIRNREISIQGVYALNLTQARQQRECNNYVTLIWSVGSSSSCRSFEATSNNYARTNFIWGWWLDQQFCQKRRINTSPFA